MKLYESLMDIVSIIYYMMRWVFQTMEYVWNAIVGSNQR